MRSSGLEHEQVRRDTFDTMFARTLAAAMQMVLASDMLG